MATRITLTRELAFASGQDAASAQMRKANRVRWNADDRDLAARITNQLLRHVPFELGGLMGLPADLVAELCA
jgi:hypothetical protein